MDLLAHWVCENCDSVDPPTFNGDQRACGICADEGENGLLIELVPASQLRGAVKALEFYADPGNWSPRDDFDSGSEVEDDRGERARDAIGAVGNGRDGQNGQKKGRNDA